MDGTGDIEPAENYTSLCKLELKSYIGDRIVSCIDKSYERLLIVDFVGSRVSSIVPRGCWCDIVLNTHASDKNKSDDSEVRFCE